MKVAIVTIIRLLAVTVLYFISFAVVSGALLAHVAPQPAPEEAGAAVLALFVVSLLNAAVWSYVILRASWTSWKLILTIFLVFFGVTTLMPQIETAFFITNLPPGMLSRLFVAGAIMAAVFAPLSALILGKARAKDTSGQLWPSMSAGAWIARLALIVVIYVAIYFTFGYFIAWQSTAVRAYYGGHDPGSFFSQIASVLRDQPSLFLLQIVRALLWTALAVPVVQMMKGKWWEAGFAVALLFAVTSSQLLLPNPLMPYDVRMAHLVETATSNFLFGWLVVLILRRSSTDYADTLNQSV
ncbi:MAG TPA: hypothetical protein VFI24_16430 [Pyrinomonadaceae bacterium]|nr:hypothetical protein [Pyrinomonadaceae bacterium]